MTARQLSQLNLENSNTTRTSSKQPRSRQDQVMTLKIELSQMAKTILNPVNRSLYQTAVDIAFQQIDDKFGAESFTETTDSTNTNPENTNTKDTNSKDTNPKDTNPKDTKYRNTNHQDSDFMSKESYSQQPDWKIQTVTEKYMKLKNMLCTIHVTSKTFLLKSRYNEHRDQYEHEMLITICPTSWLVKLGISFAPRANLFHSTISGWKHKFNPFRLVPSHALIFEFCENNNLAGVQSLMSRGEASVKDMNAFGETPLHVSYSLLYCP